MSDKCQHLVVALDRDYDFEEVQVIVDAINQLKGVSHTTINAANIDAFVARSRQNTVLAAKLFELANELLGRRT